MIAFADARVVSVAATELRSVSRTPDLRLSTSIFARVLLSASIGLFVKVSVVALPTNVSVLVGKVSVPVFEMVAMIGVVRVLFVKVYEPVKVATVESMANVTALPDPDVSIPVPPVRVRVSESRSMLSAPPVSA